MIDIHVSMSMRFALSLENSSNLWLLLDDDYFPVCYGMSFTKVRDNVVKILCCAILVCSLFYTLMDTCIIEAILHSLINGLSHPDEDVQSNTVYLFVYLLVGPWEALVPVSMQQALAQELVCLLHTAKTPYLLRNLMGNSLSVFYMLLHVTRIACWFV